MIETLELVGLACLTGAGFMVAHAAGFALLGVSLLLVARTLAGRE